MATATTDGTSIESLLPIIRNNMSGLRMPSHSSKVFKDECVFSFDSPFSDTGNYICMNILITVDLTC